VSSAAFGPTDDGAVSVDLEQLLLEDRLPPTCLFPSLLSGVGLVAHTIETLRQKDLSAHHEKIITNWYHGGIRGNFTDGKRRSLAKTCLSIIEIDDEKAREFWEKIHGPMPTLDVQS
jgi:hypothetical protein